MKAYQPRLLLHQLSIAVVTLAPLGSAVVAAEPAANLDAADFLRPDDPTCGLQDAVDALPRGGGVITVPPGTYRLRRSLVLRSHVAIRGSGSNVITGNLCQGNIETGIHVVGANTQATGNVGAVVGPSP